MQEAGRHDKANALLHDARKLEERLHKHLERLEHQKSGGETSEILERLELGMSALRELGMLDEVQHLERIAAGLKERRQHESEQQHRGDDERAVGRRQLGVMRTALEALMEAGHERSAEQLERGMHVLELALEGRRGEEVNRIRENAPSRGQKAEILMLAGRLLRERGRDDRAAAVAELAKQIAGRSRKRTPDNEREMALRNLKIMRYAFEALAEAERPDAADLVARALRTREMALEGRRDEEVRRMRASSPDAGQLVELLAMAAEILQDKGRSERAAAVGQIAGQLRERLGRDRPRREQRDRAEGRERLQRFMERVETIEHRLTDIERLMERLHKAIKGLERDGDD